jgi:hypothetical protein
MGIINRLLPPNSFNFVRWVVATSWNVKHLSDAFVEALNREISTELKNYMLTWMQRGDHTGPTGNDLPSLCGHAIAEMISIFTEHVSQGGVVTVVFVWLLSETVIQARELHHWWKRRRNRILPM